MDFEPDFDGAPESSGRKENRDLLGTGDEGWLREPQEERDGDKDRHGERKRKSKVTRARTAEGGYFSRGLLQTGQ